MSNVKTGQTSFPLQAAPAKVYRVGAGCLFTTIQSAITQATTDGFTDTTNPAVIEIYGGTYTENLTLGTGLTLRSFGATFLVGSITFSPTAGAAATNISTILDLTITPPAATGAIIVGGTVGGTLNIRSTQVTAGVQIVTNAAGAGATAIVVNNANVTLRIFDMAVQSNNNSDTIIADVQNGTLELYGGRTLFNTGTGISIGTCFKISNAATVNVFAQNAVSGSFTQVVDIQATTATFSCLRTNLQNTKVGGIMFKFTAAGNCRPRFSSLNLADATSLISSGAGTVFGGGIHYSSPAGQGITAPFSTTDTATTTVAEIGRGSFQRNSYNEFQVGRGVGYATIQAAITAANAVATGNRKVVLIPPGQYTESLTLQPNVDLVCDSLDMANMNNFSPVTIVGTHTLAWTAINQTVNLKNIRFQSLTTNATALFAVSGAFTNCKLVIKDCGLEKSFAGSPTMFSITTSAANCGLALTDCNINFTADGGSVFDLSGATNSFQMQVAGQNATTNTGPIGCGIQQGQQTAGVPPTVLLVNCPAAGGCQVVFQSLYMNLRTTQAVTLNTAGDNVQFQLCRVQQTVNAGQFFFFNGAGLAQVFNSYIQQVDAGGGGTKLIGENSGAGGSLNYGASVFGFGVVNVRASITSTQLTETLTGV